MTVASMSRMVVPFLALVAVCGVALAFAIQHVRREPPVDTKAATAAPAVSEPAPGGRDQGPAVVAREPSGRGHPVIEVQAVTQFWNGTQSFLPLPHCASGVFQNLIVLK